MHVEDAMNEAARLLQLFAAGVFDNAWAQRP
jgi:hypothetical protein